MDTKEAKKVIWAANQKIGRFMRWTHQGNYLVAGTLLKYDRSWKWLNPVIYECYKKRFNPKHQGIDCQLFNLPITAMIDETWSAVVELVEYFERFEEQEKQQQSQ